MSVESGAIIFGENEILKRVPLIRRKYVLLRVLDRMHELHRSDIERLGTTLEDDRKNGAIRSVGEVMKATLDAKVHDALLDKVALSFTEDELNREYHDVTEIPASLADTLAGEGPARPLLKSLYSLEALGLAVADYKGQGHEVFAPTNLGHVRAMDISQLFSDVHLGKNDLISLGSDGQTWLSKRSPGFWI